MTRIRKIKTPDLPTKRYSYSQLSLYTNCARKYKYKYIEHISVVGINTWMYLGSYVHKYIADLLEYKLKNQNIIAKDRLEKINVYNKLLIKETNTAIDNTIAALQKQGTLVDRSKFNAQYFDTLTHIFTGLCDEWSMSIYPETKPLSVEQKLEVDIAGIPFIMYIDAINIKNNKEYIYDWKVTKRKKSQFDVDNSLQLSIYSMATGIGDVAFCSLIRPQEGTKSKWVPRIETVTSYRTIAEINHAKHIITDTVEGIDKGYFPLCSSENYLCSEQWCEYWSMCRGYGKNKAPIWMGV